MTFKRFISKSGLLETACWSVAVVCIGSFSLMKINAANATNLASEMFGNNKQQEGAQAVKHSPKRQFDKGMIGRLEINKLNIQTAILDGTSNELLDAGVGRVAGTSYFGIPGNVALAGHRDTFFRNLKDVGVGDEIVIYHENGKSTYVVSTMKVTNPDDTDILKDGEGMTVTLITCYPFNFIGSAPQRFIVSAELKNEVLH